MEIPRPSLPEVPLETPPYTGFQIGSEEDSLANCLDLIPKPPKRDFIKFMEKDRCVHMYICMYSVAWLTCTYRGMVVCGWVSECDV